ncbi:MAG: acetate kinase [Gammaproteobacteria bacterium]|nr:acetate kinase [Gammaproteobacteria bacterium]
MNVALKNKHKVLVINAGSSSIKYSLIEITQQDAITSGSIENIGETENSSTNFANHEQALQYIFSELKKSALINNENELLCIGHRVVHGGEYFQQPAIINAEVIKNIRETIMLAPLHNPANLLGIELAMKQFNTVVQVAVFDTAFHQTLPAHAYHYAVPKAWYEQHGVRRYGFHGTSHFYVAKKAAKYLRKPLKNLNIISLHLGNGASITAIEKGKSVDTSMGMTPLEGLMMGSRCGDIDPALHFYLTKTQKLSLFEIETALNKHSGLKGICGENDMRAVRKLAESGDKNAQLALDMYIYRIKKYLGAYFATLGHVDAIVFTGGIGENDTKLREQCCCNLGALGITVNDSKNNSGELNYSNSDCLEISDKNKAVAVLVIKTNEELEIALQSAACLDHEN